MDVETLMVELSEAVSLLGRGPLFAAVKKGI
jgi:hypothetical protein